MILFLAAATFHQDVLPIFRRHCETCHRDGEVAPFSVSSYRSVRPWAKAIREAVTARRMPPWHADPEVGEFANDRRLSQPDIDTIAAWVNGGAPAGPEPSRKPAAAHAAVTPDLVVRMPRPVKIPAAGPVDYMWILVPGAFTQDTWVERVWVTPGDRRVVHHAVVLVREPGSPYMKDARPGEPYVPRRRAVPEASDVPGGRFLALGGGVETVALYVPGADGWAARPGQARLIKAGSDLLFQMHYTARGVSSEDRTAVSFTVAKQPPKQRVVNTFFGNFRLRIPPQADNYRVDAYISLYETALIESMTPHMHLRGKAFEYRAVFPNGETQVILRVPRYHFDWQTTYQLRKPLLLPKGTRLEATAWYDNSRNNPRNPDSNAEVGWGDAIWEEMFAAFVDLAIPAGSDPMDLARPRR